MLKCKTCGNTVKFNDNVVMQINIIEMVQNEDGELSTDNEDGTIDEGVIEWKECGVCGSNQIGEA